MLPSPCLCSTTSCGVHVDGVLGELAELGNAIKPLLRRLPVATKAIDKLTGGLTRAGAKALESRWYRYRTENLVTEAQKVADATGLPVPVVFDKLVRQRRIDERKFKKRHLASRQKLYIALANQCWSPEQLADI